MRDGRLKQLANRERAQPAKTEERGRPVHVRARSQASKDDNNLHISDLVLSSLQDVSAQH